jgi:membrane associated rhomboid family serine protease
MIAYIIILVTCLTSILAFNSPDIMNGGIMYPYAIKHNNQWYRFITSGFLHADWMHLFFNMLTFYFFAPNLAAFFGELFGDVKGEYYFLILYIGAIIVSNLSSYVKYHNSPGYRSLGASGAVSAVLFSFALINPTAIIYVYFIPIPAVLGGIIYLVYSWYMARRGSTRINHDAHFYGAIFGFVFTILLKPSLFPDFIDKIEYALSNR